MATVVKMPKLGFDMAEGLLVRWVVAEDQAVEKGQVLAEIETDKATVEVEALESGTVRKHLVQENTAVPVGAPIAVMGTPEEQIDVEALVAAAGGQEPAEAPSGAAPAEVPALEEPSAVAEAPRPAEAVRPGEDGDGRLPEGVRASPVARRLAAEQGLDLKSVTGSGPGGRIVKSDVEAALAAAPRPEPGAEPAALPRVGAALGPRETVRVPISKLRSAIGRRMTGAKQNVPHFYLTADLDAGPLMTLRSDLNFRMPEEAKFSVNDFLIKAAALALREFPNLNASLAEDEIVRHGEINIGVAVAVEDGLLTVVARDVDRKHLTALSGEIRELVGRARAGKVKPTDIEGSTFTVSNLGMFQVDRFIAIINPPETAILAVGSVREEPVVVDGRITVGQRLQATLSADHRVTDGAEAARWLQVFRSYVEQPVHLLV